MEEGGGNGVPDGPPPAVEKLLVLPDERELPGAVTPGEATPGGALHEG